MSQITIQCCLAASEPTRQHLWKLMAETIKESFTQQLKSLGYLGDTNSLSMTLICESRHLICECTHIVLEFPKSLPFFRWTQLDSNQ